MRVTSPLVLRKQTDPRRRSRARFLTIAALMPVLALELRLRFTSGRKLEPPSWEIEKYTSPLFLPSDASTAVTAA